MATILVVEPDPSILGLLAEVLTLQGHSVCNAINVERGAEVLVRHGAKDIELIMVDPEVPGPDGGGYGFVGSLRMRHPHLKFVFMVSAQGREKLNPRFAGSEVPVLQKPFILAEVQKVVTDALEPRLKLREEQR